MGGSQCDIVDLGLAHRLVANVSAQKLGRVQVHFPAKDSRQFFFHGEEIQAGNVMGIELDEHIDVARGAEVRPQNEQPNKARRRT